MREALRMTGVMRERFQRIEPLAGTVPHDGPDFPEYGLEQGPHGCAEDVFARKC